MGFTLIVIELLGIESESDPDTYLVQDMQYFDFLKEINLCCLSTDDY